MCDAGGFGWRSVADPPEHDGCFLVAEQVLLGAGRFLSSFLVAAGFLCYDGIIGGIGDGGIWWRRYRFWPFD